MQKPSVDMAITTGLVEAFLKCPTKCFLRARAEVATGNAYADWVRTKSDIFRSEGITRLVAGVAPEKCATRNTNRIGTNCAARPRPADGIRPTASKEHRRSSRPAVKSRANCHCADLPLSVAAVVGQGSREVVHLFKPRWGSLEQQQRRARD
jgi:hypothetical protein